MSIKVLEVTGLDYAVQEAIALLSNEGYVSDSYVSDSYWTYIENPETLNRAKFEFFLGDKDKELIMGLPAYETHKVLRYIVVYVKYNNGRIGITNYNELLDATFETCFDIISQLPYKELIGVV